MRVSDLGPPVKSSGDWDSWYHGCGRASYPDLLYNKRSGWLICKTCGLRERVGEGIDPRRQRSKSYSFNATDVNFREIEPGSPHDRYLRHRLKDQVIGEWAVHPGLLNYLTALVVERGEVTYWHARSIPTGFFGSPSYAGNPRPAVSARKWMSPDAFKQSHVYNIDSLEAGAPVFVCEGIFDALWFWPLGVALMGSRSAKGQRRKILEREPSAVYLCPDADVASHTLVDEVEAWRQESRVVKLISMRPKQGFQDWGEMLQIAGPKGLTVKEHGGVSAGNRKKERS